MKEDEEECLRQDIFLCGVFLVKYVQDLKSFWRTPQNCFVLRLLSGLYSSLPLKLCLAAEKLELLMRAWSEQYKYDTVKILDLKRHSFSLWRTI